jgi:primosomal protein N' (replication factor Y)
MTRSQQSLFDDQPEPWEVDASAQRLVASVVLTSGPDKPFDYEIPDTLRRRDQPDRYVEPGRRVQVPFGRGDQRRVAYCVAVETKAVPGRRLKQVADVVDPQSLLSPAMLRLTRWIADYYLCPWGQVLETVVPAGVRGQAGTRQVRLLQLAPHIAGQVAQLAVSSPQQRQVLEYLAASDDPLTAADLARHVGCTEGPIRRLIKEGLVTGQMVRVDAQDVLEPTAPREERLQLNADQQAALDRLKEALDASTARGFVLHGVTGSGKTEVYLQAIEHVVSFGRQAIVLVPEISLTPQTVRRFRARFDRVAVLHSRLTDVERHRYWRRIAAGAVEVVVGARSAIFAPTPHLGLIVIDEEHESTFKQDSAPRYHARDVAWQRAQAEHIPLVLGSATPSLEAWQRCELREFERLSLPSRVNNLPMPNVVTVDLRDPANSRFGRGAISRQLYQAMSAALRDGGQVILLLNRRGFSTHIQCPACGFVLQCRYCELSLTFHRQHNSAICHYCDFESAPPTTCPDCKSPAIRYGGIGTQKLEAEIKARFADYVCDRMDTDSMRSRGSHEDALEAFRRGETQILLGTQMIAKGLDFPNVTLVGVISADTALHLADFRAAERTFQLVAQVAGRTGRSDRGGRVIVQTLSPEHPAIVAAARHDFQRFATHELAIRATCHYPPLGRMVRMVVRGTLEAAARETAVHLAQRLKNTIGDTPGLRVVGPGPAPIPRLRNEYRFHLQLHAADGDNLQGFVREATATFQPPDGVLWTVDVDPWDML